MNERNIGVQLDPQSLSNELGILTQWLPHINKTPVKEYGNSGLEVRRMPEWKLGITFKLENLLESAIVTESCKNYIYSVFDSTFDKGLDFNAVGENEEVISELEAASDNCEGGIYGDGARLLEKKLLNIAMKYYAQNLLDVHQNIENDNILDNVEADDFELLADSNPMGERNFKWLQDYNAYWGVEVE